MLDKLLIGKIKKESCYLAILFLVAVIALKVVFFRDNPGLILRATLAFFWLFVLPGFFLLYYWHERINFLERLIIGFAISTGLIGILSYYLGLMGIHVKYHGFILPFVLLVMAVFSLLRKHKCQQTLTK